MGKCNCFDVKMELATDMEKRYLTVNKNGVLQLVGNYEVNVQVPSENIANDLLITDVYHSKKTVNSPSCHLKNDYGDIIKENICKPYELYLSFNNLKLLWDKRNELYLGVYKKSCSAKRFSLINDKVIHDERLKLYCYSYNDGSGDYYFYTPDEWSLEELISEDPSVFIHRSLSGSGGFEIGYNNYAISLNELYEYDELCVSDVTGGDDASFLFRHEDKDLDCYYENAISKNTVEMCFSDGESKFDVLHKVLAKSVRISSGRYINNYYSGRFPITPIPLGDLLVRYQFYDNDIMVSSWKRLNDFTDDEFNKLREVVIKLPFDEGYLFSRLLKPDERMSYIYINLNAYSTCKRLDGDMRGGSKLKRWGGGSRYKPTSDKSHPFVSVPVSFSILTADEIKHRPKPNNQFIVKIKQYTTGEFFIKH